MARRRIKSRSGINQLKTKLRKCEADRIRSHKKIATCLKSKRHMAPRERKHLSKSERSTHGIADLETVKTHAETMYGGTNGNIYDEEYIASPANQYTTPYSGSDGYGQWFNGKGPPNLE